MSTIAAEALERFEGQWTDLADRVRLVPGKQFFSDLNTELVKTYSVSITAPQIIRHMLRNEIGKDLSQILSDLDEFVVG